MLRRFYGIQNPYTLTLDQWSALLSTLGYLRRIESGSVTDEDHINRDQWLSQRRGW